MIRDFGVVDTNTTYLTSHNFGLTSSSPCTMYTMHEALTVLSSQFDDDDLYYEAPHPFAFAAKARNDDTPSYNEAMEGPDREGFLQAMDEEIASLTGLDAWNIVDRQISIDKKKRIFDVTWAFKRKRYPDGSVKKLKARLCFRGDQ